MRRFLHWSEREWEYRSERKFVVLLVEQGGVPAGTRGRVLDSEGIVFAVEFEGFAGMQLVPAAHLTPLTLRAPLTQRETEGFEAHLAWARRLLEDQEFLEEEAEDPDLSVEGLQSWAREYLAEGLQGYSEEVKTFFPAVEQTETEEEPEMCPVCGVPLGPGGCPFGHVDDDGVPWDADMDM